MKLPRFHPLVTEVNGKVGWYVCDGAAKRVHTLPVPYIHHPDRYETRSEAQEVCDILNEGDGNGVQ